MAKKSARSKGYRKYHKEKKGYTPQEIKAMAIGFSVIAILLICVLVLPDFIESFHLLKVKDGVVQGLEDNWLIANVGTSSKAKYRKLAEFDGIEGYELSSTEDGFSDANVRYFIYEPTSEDAPAQMLYVQAGSDEASELASNYLSLIGNFGEVLSIDDTLVEGEINGAKTYSIAATYRTEDYSTAIEEAEAEAEAEANGETTDTEETADDEEEEIVYDYSQSVLLYIESKIDGKCVVLQALNTGADESCFGDTEAMRALLEQAAAAITLAD